LFGARDVQPGLAIIGVPLAVLVAAYTAYLFAQAKARDLWQNPLMAPHLVVQAVLLGAALLSPVAAWLASAGAGGVFGPIASTMPQLPGAGPPIDATALLHGMVAGAAVTHLLIVLAETTLPHGTAHARLAAWEMVHGRYARWFWTGVVLVAVSCAAPWLGVPAAVAGLAGVLAHEHAYVQAGQAVPLA
jgi:formate-dependent nitrite reductase membrane component NrfD